MLLNRGRSIALISILICASVSLAADKVWQVDPNTPGIWFDPNNWLGGLPTLSDDAYVSNGGTAEISVFAQANDLYLGYTGVGHITQTDGLAQLAGDLFMGPVPYSWIEAFGGGKGGLTVTSSLALLPEDPTRSSYDLQYGALECGKAYIYQSDFINSGGWHESSIMGLGDATYTLSGDGRLSTSMLAIGYDGEGLFQQTGGLHSALGTVGVGFFGRGVYELDGGTFVSEGSLVIGGPDGNGTVTQTGGVAEIHGPVIIGLNSGSYGAYNLEGGSLLASSIETYGGTSAFNFTGGELSADNIRFSLTNTGGVLHPGSFYYGSGTTIEGDYVQDSAGTLQVRLSGSADDWLFVDGLASIDGALEIILAHGDEPYQGMRRAFMTAGSFSEGQTPGWFDSITPGWEVSLEGDYLYAEYVPEPSTLTLLAIGTLGLLRRRRS